MLRPADAGRSVGPPRRGLSIRVLGPLEVRADGGAVVVDTRKALAILVLAAIEKRALARDELAAMFWPEADDESARGALRRTLSTLRAGLSDRWIHVDRARVELPAVGVWVDAWAVDELAGSNDIGALSVATNLHRGDFLAGFSLRDSPGFDDWTASRAEARRRILSDLLDRLGQGREIEGDFAGATAAAARRLELDRLDEAGHRRLMELLARAGDRSAAMRQYQLCASVLERELGVAPLEETTGLYELIRDGRLGAARALVAPVRADPDGALASGSSSAPLAQWAHRPTDLPLVGRDRDLSRLVEAWQSSARHGRFAVLEGEAGIGKTRLAEALAGVVREVGGLVLSARSYPTEAAIPYGPIAELLRVGLAQPGAQERLAALPPDAVAQAARLLPSIPVGAEWLPPGVPGSEPAARFRLVDGLATVITGLAIGSPPGLVWVDDLAWADTATVETVAYLVRRLEARPMLVLATWRHEDLTDTLAAAVNAAEQQGQATVVRPDRLDRGSIEAIVRLIRREMDVDVLTAESEGLPLYVAEILAAGEAPGGAIPRGVRSVLASRLAAVRGMGAQVLSAAAVLGRSFDFELVRQASGRTPEEIVDGLDALVGRGILRELPALGGVPVSFDFAHGRLRDIAYDGLSLSRRRLLHGRAADALRARAAEGAGEAVRWALVAHHEREAGRLAAAAEAFAAAGRLAAALHAPVEALAHLEAALALGHPDPAALRLAIGEARIQTGDYPGAIEALRTASADAGDPTCLATIEQRLGTVHARRGELAVADSHLEAAEELLRTKVSSSPGNGRGRRRASRPAAEEAGGAANSTVLALAGVLAERAMVAHRRGDEALAARLAGQALSQLGSAAGSSEVVSGRARPLEVLGLVALSSGDLGAARAHLAAALGLAAKADLPVTVAARHALALVEARSGDRASAIQLAERALADGRQLGDRHVEAALENTLADLLHDAGRPAESMAHLKRAVAIFAEVGGTGQRLEPEIWKLVEW